MSLGADLHRRGGQHLAVQRYAALADQPLDIAARGDAGARQHLGDAVAAGMARAEA